MTDTTTVIMNRELALHTIIDAYKKGCDITTLEIIAGGVLDKFAQYQWSLPVQEGETSGDEVSINTDSSATKTKSKTKKPKTPPTPLDFEAFRKKFDEDASSIKKNELVKAIGSNGYNIGHLCPETVAVEDKKKGNKLLCMKSEQLRDVLRKHFTAQAPECESDGDEDCEEPLVEEVPRQKGKHTRFD